MVIGTRFLQLQRLIAAPTKCESVEEYRQWLLERAARIEDARQMADSQLKRDFTAAIFHSRLQTYIMRGDVFIPRDSICDVWGENMPRGYILAAAELVGLKCGWHRHYIAGYGIRVFGIDTKQKLFDTVLQSAQNKVK